MYFARLLQTTEEKHMKSVALLLSFLIALVAVAEEPKQTHRYVFGAGGGLSDSNTITMNYGVGFETLFYKGLGVNADLSYFAPVVSPISGVGMLCLNGSYHFNHKRDWSPYVTAGYSLFFREGAVSFINIGGGVQLPLESGHLLRLEFRDHIYGAFSENSGHSYGIRIGWTF
jgi:hypothetical protein